jgi:DNA polymerase
MSSNEEINSLISKVEKYLTNQSDMYGNIIFQSADLRNSAKKQEIGMSEQTNSRSHAENPSISDNSIKSATDEHQTNDIVTTTSVTKSPIQENISLPVEKSDLSKSVLPMTKITKEIPSLENIHTLKELESFCRELDILKTDLPNTNLVFGKGNPQADLMLIGEAPGAEEDKLGEPFVGRSGQLLTKILQAIEFERDQIYIANILKHRPPDNRNPTADERERSLPYLVKQIEIINPKLILCLGKISAETLLGIKSTMKDMRGVFHNFGNNYELLVTYHPAALLRNPNWKRDTWEDVQLLRKRYNELGCKP